MQVMKCQTGGTYGHSSTYTIFMFWEVWHKLNFVQVEIKHRYGQLYVYIQGSSVEIQTPTDWNLISHSMTALLPVLVLSNILLPTSSHSAFIPTRKNSAHV
jgi:hypothetical protein